MNHKESKRYILSSPPDSPPKDAAVAAESSVDPMITQQKKQKAAAMVPMSREQYEAQQSQIREVYDEESVVFAL